MTLLYTPRGVTELVALDHRLPVLATHDQRLFGVEDFDDHAGVTAVLDMPANE